MAAEENQIKITQEQDKEEETLEAGGQKGQEDMKIEEYPKLTENPTIHKDNTQNSFNPKTQNKTSSQLHATNKEITNEQNTSTHYHLNINTINKASHNVIL